MALAVVGFFWYYGSPKYTDVGYRPRQPVPYSHKLHAGDLGIDCRYCHYSVEKSAVANIPPTSVCMNCHTLILPESEKLLPVRESWATGEPIKWVRIHKIGEYAYFNHSIHIDRGVSCISCHGNVADMEVVEQKKPLSMGWCLECHRCEGGQKAEGELAHGLVHSRVLTLHSSEIMLGAQSLPEIGLTGVAGKEAATDP